MRTVLLTFLTLIIVLIMGLLATLGITGIGWVTVQIFPAFSHFEASLIALIISSGLFLVAYRFFTLATMSFGPWEEENWLEDEMESPAPSRRSKSGAGKSTKKKR